MALVSVIITVTTIGLDAGPFTVSDGLGNTYSGITRPMLLAGYLNQFDDTAASITVTSTGACTNSLVIPFSVPPSPTPAASISATPSVTVTPTVTPSNTPAPGISVTPTVTPSNSTVPGASVTPSITITPSITVTPSITITPSITVTPSVTVTPTISVTPDPTTTPSTTPLPITCIEYLIDNNGGTAISWLGIDCLTGNNRSGTVNPGVQSSFTGCLRDGSFVYGDNGSVNVISAPC